MLSRIALPAALIAVLALSCSREMYADGAGDEGSFIGQDSAGNVHVNSTAPRAVLINGADVLALVKELRNEADQRAQALNATIQDQARTISSMAATIASLQASANTSVTCEGTNDAHAIIVRCPTCTSNGISFTTCCGNGQGDCLWFLTRQDCLNTLANGTAVGSWAITGSTSPTSFSCVHQAKRIRVP